jgi:hypothetical protein
MALDTKLNLTNQKFEQTTGDTLNISGTTVIFGNLRYNADKASTYIPRSFTDFGFYTGNTGVGFSKDTGAVRSVRSNVDVIGNGTITVTNGSATINGTNTNFTDSTTGLGLNYWFSLHFTDSSNRDYRVDLTSITNSTLATAQSFYSESDIQRGYTTRSATFTGTTGTYPYKIVTNYAKDLYSVALGNKSYARNFGVAIGGSTVANGQAAVALGLFSAALNTAATAIGTNTIATGQRSFAGGWGATTSFIDRRVRAGGNTSFNFSENNTSQTTGHGALAQASAILGGWNHNIPSNSLRSVVIGGNAIKADSATTDTVFMPKVRIGLGTSGSLTNNNANTNIIVRNATTGELEIRSASSLTGTSVITATNGLNKSGNVIRLGGTVTGNTTISISSDSEVRELIFNANINDPDIRARFKIGTIDDGLSIIPSYSLEAFSTSDTGSIITASDQNLVMLSTDSVNSTFLRMNPTEVRVEGDFTVDGNVNLSINDEDDGIYVNDNYVAIFAGGYSSAIEMSDASISLYSASALPQSYGSINLTNKLSLEGKDSSNTIRTQILLTSTGATFVDNRTTKSGFQYAGNYSSGFTNFSLVHAGFVTGITSNVGSGLNRHSSGQLRLGGSLSATTTITGNNGAYSLRLGNSSTSRLNSFNVHSKNGNFLYSTADSGAASYIEQLTDSMYLYVDPLESGVGLEQNFSLVSGNPRIQFSLLRSSTQKSSTVNFNVGSFAYNSQYTLSGSNYYSLFNVGEGYLSFSADRQPLVFTTNSRTGTFNISEQFDYAFTVSHSDLSKLNAPKTVLRLAREIGGGNAPQNGIGARIDSWFQISGTTGMTTTALDSVVDNVNFGAVNSHFDAYVSSNSSMIKVLSITRSGATYGNNYSSSFGKFSLVDVNYVTGMTSSLKVSATITGNSVTTSFVVTHNKNTRDIIVQVYDMTTYETVLVDVVRTTVNNVRIDFLVAPASGVTYKIVII